MRIESGKLVPGQKRQVVKLLGEGKSAGFTLHPATGDATKDMAADRLVIRAEADGRAFAVTLTGHELLGLMCLYRSKTFADVAQAADELMEAVTAFKEPT